jgi:hypothetical protein
MYKNDSAFNFELQAYELDKQWLKFKNSTVTDDDLENFADKCASVAIDNPEYTDNEIRRQAYDALWGMK